MLLGIHLQQPLHPQAGHQRIGQLCLLANQGSTLSAGIHQPAAAQPAATSSDIAHHGANASAILMPANSRNAELQAGAPGLGLAS